MLVKQTDLLLPPHQQINRQPFVSMAWVSKVKRSNVKDLKTRKRTCIMSWIWIKSVLDKKIWRKGHTYILYLFKQIKDNNETKKGQ